MLEVTLTEQYQLDIPKEICDSLHFKTGQKFRIELIDDLITFVPQPSINSFHGVLKGANVNNIRDNSERI